MFRTKKFLQLKKGWPFFVQILLGSSRIFTKSGHHATQGPFIFTWSQSDKTVNLCIICKEKLNLTFFEDSFVFNVLWKFKNYKNFVVNFVSSLNECGPTDLISNRIHYWFKTNDFSKVKVIPKFVNNDMQPWKIIFIAGDTV